MKGIGCRWIGVLVVLIGLGLSGCTGCSRDAVAAPNGPYRIAEIEVVGEPAGWAPTSEEVEHWFRRALRESERGIAGQGSGPSMRARIDHRLLVVNHLQGSTLRIEVDVQLEAMEVDAENPALLLTARGKYRHPFAVEAPTEAVLRPLSQTLVRETVEGVVMQLRDQAVVRQTLAGE